MDGPPQASADGCALCSGAAAERPFPGALPWLARCGRCGLVYASPQPSDAELAGIYDEHYYDQFGFVEGPHANDAGLARTKRETYARMLAVASRELRSGGRRLLDVGCGLGFSLLAARDAGFDATGLDPLGPERPDARPGRFIVRGDLGSYVPDAPFNLVSMIDVIEHVRDPVATLRQARALLAPGGVLLLATNDSSSLGARLLGPRWTHFHRAHLWFFTPSTLRTVAERAGFEVRVTRGAARVYNLEYIASILARGTNFPLAARVSRGLLKGVPHALAALAWPPLPEGFVLVARRPESPSAAPGSRA